jgi:pimeloyl-ACP methyl ester carboxylesterase
VWAAAHGDEGVIIEQRFAAVIRERQVGVDGVIGQVLTAGEGAPLVLLHGDGDSPAVWQWVLPALARAHRVFAPSLPGHADTDKPRRDYSREYMTRFMRGFLDALGLDRCVLVGHSIGGLVALRLALADPDRFPALVLLDSAGLGPEVSPLLALESLPWAGEFAVATARSPFGGSLRALSRLSQLFWRYDRAPASWLAEQRRLALLPGFLDASIAAKRAVLGPVGQREVLLDQLHRLPMPTLVVWGANDGVVPVVHAHSAVHRLPHAELAVIPQCGHTAHVERPEEFLGALVPFLSRHRNHLPTPTQERT